MLSRFLFMRYARRMIGRHVLVEVETSTMGRRFVGLEVENATLLGIMGQDVQGDRVLLPWFNVLQIAHGPNADRVYVRTRQEIEEHKASCEACGGNAGHHDAKVVFSAGKPH